MPSRPRLVRRGVAALAAGLLGLGVLGAASPALGADPPAVRATDSRVEVGAEPDGSSVSLDVTVRSPEGGKHPAVLLAHGFGGSKADMADRAQSLAEKGYVVLTWTARGFGDSGGRIHLDDPAYEGKDVTALLDVLAARPDVQLDGPGDPRVAMVGGSYGGAIGLLGAALDKRVDTVVAAITWNDLAESLFPQADPDAQGVTGPVKQLWISRFFAASVAGARSETRPPGGVGATTGTGDSAGTGGTPGANASRSPASPESSAGQDPAAGSLPSSPEEAAARAAASAGSAMLCGRFDPALCAGLTTAAETGTPTPQLLATLRAHSPAAVLDRITVPVFLIQGMADSLFGLDQADATARGLLHRKVPVAVRWIDGGHDGPSSTAEQDDAAADTWLAHYLTQPQQGAASGLPVPAFVYAGTATRRTGSAPLYSHDSYPGVAAAAPRDLTSLGFTPGRQQVVLTPPGGQPASVTSFPGIGGAAGLPTFALAALPGQSATFNTRPLPESVTTVGSPRLTLRVTSTGTEVTLFVSLWQVNGDVVSQPRALVAPVRVPTTPGVPVEVPVDLPAATWQMPTDGSWRVLVTSTDSSFDNPRQARADQIEIVEAMTLPTLTGTRLKETTEADTESIGVGIAIGVVLLGILIGWLVDRRRRAARHRVPEFADIPLVVGNLVKTYSDGHRAVNDVSWQAQKGQVVGLLGPNGAGKTTTIRMVLGLIRPDSGSVHVLGQPVSAGSSVLARVGALVEGPGFLPHLTGRANLEAYWRATGRPIEEAGFEEALSVAALGGALDRPVRTYSHGMRQRLGIAQAMLGLPELLILDEPTNGLDPPQIAAMRPILHAYAAGGRTVVISSHLLAEVEQTCSHVVVMHAGRVVTAGAVADLIASENTTVLDLGVAGADAARVGGQLEGLRGIRSVDVEEGGAPGRITVVADLSRSEVVRQALEAGGDVVGVGSRRHLEEVFLGVIAKASAGEDRATSGGSLIERLRQVRER